MRASRWRWTTLIVVPLALVAIGVVSYLFVQASSDKNDAEAQLEVTEDELDQASVQLAATEQEVVDQQARLSQSEDELSQTRGRLSRTEDQLSDARDQLSGAEAGLADARSEVESSQAELATASAALGDATARLAVAEALLEEDDLSLLDAISSRPLPTLRAVTDRGTLICGVGQGSPGFTVAASDGTLEGFDVDFCRALAAAVLGDAGAVELRQLSAAERFEALNDGEVDVLIRNTTWTQSRDATLGFDFGPTTFFDGQQLMGRRSQFSTRSALGDISGAVLCSPPGTTTAQNVVDGARFFGASITLEQVETFAEALEKFQAGVCDLVTTDGSGLAASKSALDVGDDWVIFPAAPISKEPLGPVYRSNDSEWADVVNWTVFATIIAEEQGVTSGNVQARLDELRSTHQQNPSEMGRLLGLGGNLQEAMGLSADAFFQVLLQVGNYGEIYDRNLAPVGLAREGGLNASFQNFGLMYAPPAR